MGPCRLHGWFAFVIFSLCMGGWFTSQALSAASSCDSDFQGKIISEIYTFVPRDTLSVVLYRLKKSSGTPFCLYGKKGWVTINQDLNKHIKNWHAVLPGEVITIQYPVTETSLPAAVSEEVKVRPPQIEQPMEQVVPEEPMVEESDHIAPINLVGRGYSGIRHGISLVRHSELLAKSRITSLFVETRSAPINGLRFYWDYVSKAEATLSNQRHRFGWDRWVLGWAYGLDLASLGILHFTPKVGRYNFDAVLPYDGQNSVVTEQVAMKGKLSFGYELDLETNMMGTLFKAWFGQDVSGRALNANFPTAVYSKKFGLDAYIDGPTLSMTGRESNLVFIAFAHNETLKLEGKGGINGNQDLTITLNVPYAGLGLGLSW